MAAFRSRFLIAFSGLLAASCSGPAVRAAYGPAAAVIRPVSAAEVAPLHLPSPGPESSAPAGDSDRAFDVSDNEREAARVVTLRLAAESLSIQPEPAPPPAPPARVMLGPLPFVNQTANNCGPASITEVLSFWGVHRSQGEAQAVLRGDGNPYGMTPAGVPGYMASAGMEVVLGTSGSPELIKTLLTAGFPVIVNQSVSLTDKELHYRPVQGFDDERGVFLASDPLLGPDYAIGYAEFQQDWAYTSQRFIVIYPPDKTDMLNAALDAGNWDRAFAEGGGQAPAWALPGDGGPPPRSTPMVTGQQAPDGSYRGPLTVSFSASDPVGFGVAATFYAIDGQPARPYRGPFRVTSAGKHTIAFHSVSFSGNREPDRTLDVSIDTYEAAAATSAAAAPNAKPQGTSSAAPSAAVKSMPANGYSICPLYDQAKANKIGSPVAIKLQLCDTGGRNLSSAAVAVTTQSILGPPTGFKPPLPSPFRYDPGLAGYQTEVPAGPGLGTYVLYFSAAGDPSQHMLQFRIG